MAIGGIGFESPVRGGHEQDVPQKVRPQIVQSGVNKDDVKNSRMFLILTAHFSLSAVSENVGR